MNFRIIICFLIIIFINNFVLSQSNPKPANTFEIITRTTGTDSVHNTVKFWMQSVDAIWDKDECSYSLCEQKLISGYNYAIATYLNDHSVEDIPIPNESDYYGLWHVLTNWYVSNHTYGYGMYNFYIGYDKNNPLIHFKIDFRDCDYSDNYDYNDTWIKFNATNKSAKIDWNDDKFDDARTVQNGQIFKLWIEKHKSVRNNVQKKDFFELYLTLSNQNNHPYLEWNAYHDTNIIGYYLYREVHSTNGTTLDKLAINGTSYLDIEILLGSSKSAVAKYWVKARINSTTESLAGNSVSTRGEFQPQKISTNNKRDKELPKFRLSANFPNPFNPSTIITYELPKREYVTLKVYNSLGKEVAVLVEGQKEAGNYSVTFNAKSAAGGLPSGIYLYKLTSGNFTKIRKMMLLK